MSRLSLILILITTNVLADEQIRSLAQAAINKDGTGSVSIGIIEGSELVYAEAFGYADMEQKIDATPEHVYRIGSITKQFTGLALLKLAHEGALQLTDPVEQHFKPVNLVRDRFPNAPPITLVQLATMTSGLSREPEDLPSYLVGPTSKWIDVVIKALPKVRYDFPPDTIYQYSNIGYAILGAALEKATNRNFIDYVREEIIVPLGLKDTDFLPQPHYEERIATGYQINEGKIDERTPLQQHAGRGYKVPNGALYSTVFDLAKFISFQLGYGPEHVIPKDVLFKNFSKTNSANGTLTSGYGIGFRVLRRGNLIVFGHGGGVAGYRAGAYFDRISEKGVVVLRNVGGGSLDVTELAMTILEMVEEKK